ncbi:Protein alcS, partial [Lachnellula cervina]
MSHLQNPHAAAPISGNNYQDNASTLYPNSDAAPISSNNYNQQSRTDYYHQNGDGNGSVDVNGAPLEQTQSSLSISPALFEKLYLSPQNAVKGDLRKTFGNPTPLALVGFTVALAPISIQLMGWRGAMGQTATVGATYFFGGMLLMISGLLEFFLGNTFPCVVFFGYGGHFLTFGSTFQPFYNAVAAYTPDGTQELTPAFASSFAFYT